jgi:hypothetical protein
MLRKGRGSGGGAAAFLLLISDARPFVLVPWFE